jgi:hypothetical protein
VTNPTPMTEQQAEKLIADQIAGMREDLSPIVPPVPRQKSVRPVRHATKNLSKKHVSASWFA